LKLRDELFARLSKKELMFIVHHFHNMFTFTMIFVTDACA
jgi:hypothetical protein